MKTDPIVDLDQISINLKTAEQIKKKINILFIYHDSIKNTEFKLQFAVIFYKLMSRDNRDYFISFLTEKADHSILNELTWYDYDKNDKNTSCACI